MTGALDYRPREYWGERIAGNGNLANVGQVALGAYNEHAYPFRLAALERGIEGIVPERPRVCASLQPSEAMCGTGRNHALRWLARLEQQTRPATPIQ